MKPKNLNFQLGWEPIVNVFPPILQEKHWTIMSGVYTIPLELGKRSIDENILGNSFHEFKYFEEFSQGRNPEKFLVAHLNSRE
jgi:hypothetical protein